MQSAFLFLCSVGRSIGKMELCSKEWHAFRWPIETLNEPMPHLSCTQSPRQCSVSYHYAYFDPSKKEKIIVTLILHTIILCRTEGEPAGWAMFDLAGFADMTHLKQLRTKLPMLCSWCHYILVLRPGIINAFHYKCH